MKLVILSIFVNALVFVSSAHSNAVIPTQVKKTIGDLIRAEKEHDYLAAEILYFPKATIFIERIHPNNKPAEYIEIPARKTYQIAMETKSQSVQRDSHDNFTDIKYEWMGDDIKVSATRHSKLKNSKTPHVFVLKQDQDSEWKIAQEYSIEYVMRQKDDSNNVKIDLFN